MKYIILFLIPVIMFLCHFLLKNPPKMNKVLGYRTKMAMKNEDTWQFANKYCSDIYKNMAINLCLMNIVIIVLRKYIEKYITIDTILLVWIIIQEVTLISAVFFVEIKLKKVFDKDGNRREIY